MRRGEGVAQGNASARAVWASRLDFRGTLRLNCVAMLIKSWVLLNLFAAAALGAPLLRGNLGIHDPSTIIKCKDRYYMFGTGPGILSKSSADKIFWRGGPSVFASAPAWTTNAVAGFTGVFWAPDIFFLSGKYCLYYAVSTWGSQVSAIGLATNPSLDPTDPAYHWTDQGPVIQSGNGSLYNTIDPSVTLDAAGNPWMSFGSYWNGIYVVGLDPTTGLRVAPNSPTYRVAWKDAIEASCVLQRGIYYYLFVDWGSCCSGVNSTYNLRVGRSTSITGPYLDRNGVDMVAGGGTLFLEGTGKFTGPGHLSILSENGVQQFSYHYYDAGAWSAGYNAYGAPDFDLEPLSWTPNNWPVFTNDWSAVYRFQADARDENGQYYGQLQGGASIRTEPVHGRVLNLNGSGQYVKLPPGVAYARTFVAVVKWNGGGPWQRIFDFGTDTSSYVMLTPWSGDGKLRCDIRAGGSTQIVAAPGPLPVGVWTHVALTLDGSRGILFSNGVPVATNTITISPLEVRAETNYLGHSKYVADPDFNGQFAGFRVYGRALSPAEMVAPQTRIAQPAPGATYQPGDTLAFSGSAADFRDLSLAPTGLTWTVQFRYGGTTNTVLGPLSGVTNGSFTIPTTGAAATNGSYHLELRAVDPAGRAATSAVDVFPASAAGTAAWSSFYPFTSGFQDASNRFNGGPLNGASIQTDAARGSVLNLNGNSQYVLLPLGVGAMQTFAGWVKWSGGGAWQRIFDFGQGTTRWTFLTPMDSSGRMQCALTTESANFVQVIQTPAALPVNTWWHLAVVFDGRQGILYTNGQVAAINNSVNLLPSDIGGTGTYLGRSQYPADPYFNGRLDSVRLDSRALSLMDLVAPSAVITQPAPGSRYAGGDLIAYAGNATDYSGAPLTATNFTWSGEFHHDGQTDVVFGPVAGATNGSFQVPTTGPASTNVFYRLNLVVTDPSGNQNSAVTDIPPELSALNFFTVPPGLQIVLDGQALTAPASVTAVAGLTRTVAAPPTQELAGSNYTFVVWSDGGAASHPVRVPDIGANYTASYVPPLVTFSSAPDSLLVGWPAWASSMNLYVATNLSPPVAWTFFTNAAAADNPIALPLTSPNAFYRLKLP